jgi:hypothetical protein
MSRELLGHHDQRAEPCRTPGPGLTTQARAAEGRDPEVVGNFVKDGLTDARTFQPVVERSPRQSGVGGSLGE